MSIAGMATAGANPVGGRYLVFTIGGEEYAVRLGSVLEILARPEITRVPLADPWLIGVFNLRGEVLSVIDIKSFIGSDGPAASEPGKVLVISTPLYRAGVPVDKVEDFVTIGPDEVTSAGPTEGERAGVKHVHLHGGRMIRLLDIEAVLTSPQFQTYL